MRSTNATITILALTIITPAMGATLHVPTDYGTIQACIDAALDGVDECVVAPGTYNETINFNGKAITLRSTDGPAATTIDATGLNNSVVTCANGEGADTVLDGFTITGGTGTLVDSFFLITSGGGMYNHGSSPTLTNCTFSGNSASQGGGMSNNNSSPALTHCTFNGNSASNGGGGGMYNYSGSFPTLTNCIFRGNSASQGGGMSNNNSSPALTHCTFSGNTAGFGGGMSNSLASSPTLTNCTFSGNTADFDGGGMSNSLSSSPTLTNCTFSENTADFGGGGMSNNNSSPTLANCILWNNVPDQISQNFDSTTTVSYSCVQGGWAGTGNIAGDPLLVDADGLDDIPGTDDDDLHFQSGSPCIDTGRNAMVTVPTDLDGNPRVIDGDQDGIATVDMGAYEFTLPLICGNGVLDPGEECDDGGESDTCDMDCTQAGCGDEVLNIAASEQCDDGNLVSGDGCSAACMIEDVELHVPGDFPTIQTCISAAVNGNECVVAPGTYNETINFNGKAVTVRSSDGQAATTIDATGLNNSVVKCVSGEGADTVLDGFTITGGTGVLGYGHRLGGGMYNRGSSPTLTHCTFSGNTADSDGGGGGMYNSDGSPTLTNCIFSGNSADSGGGGMYNDGGSPTLANCTFSGNSASDSGGGMYGTGSSPTLTNCTFSGNSAFNGGGGMYNTGSSPTLTHCTFSGNSASLFGGGSGGAMYNERSSNSKLANCIFSENSAFRGGAMYNTSSSPTLTHCTFSGNSARFTGGGMYNSFYSSPTLTNCILWNNAPNQIFFYSTTVSYSCVQGGWAGTGNIAVDPLFVDSGFWDDNGTPIDTSDDIWVDGDYRLQSGSPCIDAGDPAFVPQPGETDLDGHARVLCGDVDMGAFEFGIGDHDCDRVVGLTDFAQWNACMTGPEAGPYAAGCEAFDFDGDGDIGLADFAGFQRVFQGQ